MTSIKQTREVAVGDYIDIIPRLIKIKTNEYLPAGSIPIVDQGDGMVAGYIGDESKAYNGPLPIIVFGDHTCRYKYVDFRFAVGADGTQLIRPKDDFDVRYFYYCLLTVPLEQFGYQRHFKYLKEAKVLWRPLKEQQKIVEILSAYDDLIENNTRRIRILEGMARLIYREWFVEFRAPGVRLRKATPQEQALTGKDRFPEGWEIRPLGDVALNYDSKRKPISSMKRKEMQGIYPYYGAAKVLDYVNDFIFDGKYLLLAEDGSVATKEMKPVLQIVDCKFWPNNHTHILQGKDPFSTDFLYLTLLDLNVAGYITGAAQPKITQENMNRMPVVVSDAETLARFKPLAEQYIDVILIKNRININLQKTRDLLLPYLISDRAGLPNAV